MEWCVNLDMEPKCVRFLSVAQECGEHPRRSFLLSCKDVSASGLWGEWKNATGALWVYQRHWVSEKLKNPEQWNWVWLEHCIVKKWEVKEDYRSAQVACDTPVTAEIWSRRKVQLGSYTAKSLVKPSFKGLGKATSGVVFHSTVHLSLSLFLVSDTKAAHLKSWKSRFFYCRGLGTHIQRWKVHLLKYCT